MRFAEVLAIVLIAITTVVIISIILMMGEVLVTGVEAVTGVSSSIWHNPNVYWALRLGAIFIILLIILYVFTEYIGKTIIWGEEE